MKGLVSPTQSAFRAFHKNAERALGNDIYPAAVAVPHVTSREASSVDVSRPSVQSAPLLFVP